MVTKTEHYSGSDATGSTGGSDRVLTISNTKTTTDNGFLVFVSGLELKLTEQYTVSHKSASTEITFLNPLWDDQEITVNYVEELTGAGVPGGSTDFELGPLSNFGVEVTRTAVTTTTDFSGNKKYTDGSDTTITVVFKNPNQKFDLDKAGLTEGADAIMFTKATETINKYDKITYDSDVYRVDTVSTRNFDGTAMFKTVTLFYVKNE